MQNHFPNMHNFSKLIQEKDREKITLKYCFIKSQLYY